MCCTKREDGTGCPDRLLKQLLRWEKPHTHTSRAALRPGIAAVVLEISRPGLRFCESSGFCGDLLVRWFQSTQDGVDACVLSSITFGGAASFSVFELGDQERSTQRALAEASPRSVAKSFLHVGDVIVRRQDTSRTRVQVVDL